MSEITPFEFNGARVRVLTIDGEPWWVVNDVCSVLDISDPSSVVQRLENDDLGQTRVTDSLGREQLTNIVNESGLYELVIRSDKSAARPFRRWITSEVLPAIAGILFYDHQGGMRVMQHPWKERGWATDRWERYPAGRGFGWVTYFTPAGVVELRKRFA